MFSTLKSLVGTIVCFCRAIFHRIERWKINGIIVFTLDELKKSLAELANAKKTGDSEALKKAGRGVCDASRRLVDLTAYVFFFPEVWPEERVNDAYIMLQEAAKVTSQTIYASSCAYTPHCFKECIASLRLAQQASERIRQEEGVTC